MNMRRFSPAGAFRSLQFFTDERVLGLLRVGLLIPLLGLFLYIEWLLYPAAGFQGLGLRYLVLPLLAVLAALWAAVRAVRTIYELPSSRLALKYLLAMLFHVGLPAMTIDDGQKLLRFGEQNLLDLVGGPGTLAILPGSTVVLEHAQRRTVVLGPGTHTLSRFDRIYEIFSLEEQQGELEQVRAISKDGIEVVVRQARFRYRLITEAGSGSRARRLQNPYPFSEEAARNRVYNRLFGPEGAQSWHESVQGVIEKEIRTAVNEMPLEMLVPSQVAGRSPRTELCRRLSGGAARERLRALGAELVWCDVSSLGVVERQTDDQRQNAWLARWNTGPDVLRGYYDLQSQIYQEIGRAEGTAEVLISVVHALDGVELRPEARQQQRGQILESLGRLLESMREEERGPGA